MTDKKSRSGTVWTPRELQRTIAGDAIAARRVFCWLDSRGIGHSETISGATMAAVCGVHPRTWRKWVGGERKMPASARRLIVEVAGIDAGEATVFCSSEG